MNKIPRQAYTTEFKIEAAKMVIEGRKPLNETARTLGIPNTTLAGWAKKYKSNGDFKDHRRKNDLTDEQAEISRLKKELADARTDVEILKKAAAYFAQESRKSARR